MEIKRKGKEGEGKRKRRRKRTRKKRNRENGEKGKGGEKRKKGKEGEKGAGKGKGEKRSMAPSNRNTYYLKGVDKLGPSNQSMVYTWQQGPPPSQFARRAVEQIGVSRSFTRRANSLGYSLITENPRRILGTLPCFSGRTTRRPEFHASFSSFQVPSGSQRLPARTTLL